MEQITSLKYQTFNGRKFSPGDIVPTALIPGKLINALIGDEKIKIGHGSDDAAGAKRVPPLSPPGGKVTPELGGVLTQDVPKLGLANGVRKGKILLGKVKDWRVLEEWGITDPRPSMQKLILRRIKHLQKLELKNGEQR